MFDWVAPDKKQFFYILLTIIAVEIWLVYVMANIEHQRYDLMNPPKAEHSAETAKKDPA